MIIGDFVTNCFDESWDSFYKKSWVPVQNQWVPVLKIVSPIILKLRCPNLNRALNWSHFFTSKAVCGVLKLEYSLKEKCSFNNNLALTWLTAGYIRSFRNWIQMCLRWILSVKLSTDITVHKIFILIILQPAINLQPLRKKFPFFLFAIVVGSWSTASNTFTLENTLGFVIVCMKRLSSET